MPNISYSTITSNSSLFNQDLQIHSTIELSASQTCNESFTDMEFPHQTVSPYISKSSPKIVASVSGTYVPLETSVDKFSLSSNRPKAYSSRKELSSSYGSFEKHFLWDTSLFFSQTHPVTQELSTKMNNIFKCKKIEKVSAGDSKILKFEIEKSKTTQKLFLRDKFSSNLLTLKRNSYSIEEILRTPEKKIRPPEKQFFNQLKCKVNDDIQLKVVNGENDHCFEEMKEAGCKQKKKRIKYKVHDIIV